MKNHLDTIETLVKFYEDHMKEFYEDDLKYYEDHEDIILLQRDIQDHKNVKDYFKIPISNIEHMSLFFKSLSRDGLLFHPEDCPTQIMTVDGRLFNDVECEYLKDRLNEVFAIHSDPCKWLYENIYLEYYND